MHMHRQSAEAVEAVAAAARNVVLRAPDKADARTAAVSCAVALVRALPRSDQHRFVVFVARLSRTPKVMTHPMYGLWPVQ